MVEKAPDVGKHHFVFLQSIMPLSHQMKIWQLTRGYIAKLLTKDIQDISNLATEKNKVKPAYHIEWTEDNIVVCIKKMELFFTFLNVD